MQMLTCPIRNTIFEQADSVDVDCCCCPLLILRQDYNPMTALILDKLQFSHSFLALTLCLSVLLTVCSTMGCSSYISTFLLLENKTHLIIFSLLERILSRTFIPEWKARRVYLYSTFCTERRFKILCIMLSNIKKNSLKTLKADQNKRDLFGEN